MMLSNDEYQVMCRQDFYTFMHRAFCELNRDAVFYHNWHNELIASKLQSCLDGQTTRLIHQSAAEIFKVSRRLNLFSSVCARTLAERADRLRQLRPGPCQ